MNFRSIANAPELRGKKVLVRVDFNVPLVAGQHDSFSFDKLEKSLATIRFLISRGARVMLMTHLGRPQGKRDPKLSTKVLVPEFSRQLGRRVIWSSGLAGAAEARRAQTLKNGEVLLLENTRFNPGEEKNSPNL